MTTKRAFLAGALTAVVLTTVGFGAGYLTRSWIAPTDIETPLLAEAQRLLTENYFGELPDEQALQRGMIQGMVQAIGDPHTTYQEPASHALQSDQLAGEYAGIGVEITRDEGGRILLFPLPGGPAELAGVLDGDVLLEIDGETAGTEEQVRASLRGEVGSQVNVSLAPRSGGSNRVQLMIERVSFPLPTVSVFHPPEAPQVAVFRISLFSDQTLRELQHAYQELQAGDLAGIILDLRGNAGGLIDEGIEVARFFMQPGIIITERGKEAEERRFVAEEAGIAAELPLVVLINAGTASAAEVVAGALQSSGRAQLVGSRSFGKGSIQVVLELSDGSSLHVTTARWTPPSGISIDGIGLEPNLPVVDESAGPDQAIYSALELLDN